MNPPKYTTLLDALDQLKELGFVNSFNLEEDNTMRCLESDNKYRPGDLEIVYYQRFEGNSNPSDMSIIFALKCLDGTRGVVISSYGVYTNNKLSSFMNEVKIADQTEATGILTNRSSQ